MIILERFAYTPVGTFGRIYAGSFSCYSVERPWANNEPFESCIPEGRYLLAGHQSRKYGDVFAVVNDAIGVTQHKEDGSRRYAILIHAANYASQLQGCIAPGLDLGCINGNWSVTRSRKTLSQLNEVIHSDKDGVLWIRQYRPEYE